VLEKPIVLVLLVLTILSTIVAIRFKPNKPVMNEDGPYKAHGRRPQLLFYSLVLIFVALVVGDTFRHQENLTIVYPWFTAGLSLVFLIPMGIQLVGGKRPATVFYDSEHEAFSEHIEYRSNEYYLLWLLGMLGVSALFGFVIGIAAFIYIFIFKKAEWGHQNCAISAGAFVLFLGALSHFLTLEYPPGVLQSVFQINLPWPLQ
jgi:hypothetical protein